MATFQERFKMLRLEKNWTLDDVAELLDTTKSTLSRYENGHREPKIEFAEKAAELFNVTTDYLLGKSDVKKGVKEDDRLKILFRKADILSEEEREEILNHFENTLDIYLKHKK